MSKYIKSFNDATSMRAYLDTAEGFKYYLLKNEAGEDGIGATPESGKKIVSLYKGRDYLTFTALQTNSSIKYKTGITNTTAEYSIDGGTTWVDGVGVTVTLQNIGDKVLYRGVISGSVSYNSARFEMTGRISASGSIMSMYNNNPNDSVISQGRFAWMFYGTNQLIEANIELPATTLTNDCYNGMFVDCSNLTTGPQILPATTLTNNCYRRMFQNCNSLTAAPVLSATTLASSCYQEMFDGCSLIDYIKINVVNWNTSNSSYWIRNTAATGIVECPVGCTIPSDSTEGVPTGWTKVEF